MTIAYHLLYKAKHVYLIVTCIFISSNGLRVSQSNIWQQNIQIINFSSTACLISPMFDFYEWAFLHPFCYCLLCTGLDKIDTIIDLSFDFKNSFLADQNCIIFGRFIALYLHFDLKKTINFIFLRNVIC